MITFTCDWSPADLAPRIAALVVGRPDEAWEDPAGRWQLGGGNNWVLRTDGPGRFRLSYRYEQRDDPRMAGLAAALPLLVHGAEVVTP